MAETAAEMAEARGMEMVAGGCGSVRVVPTSPSQELTFFKDDMAEIVSAMCDIEKDLPKAGWVNIGCVLNYELAQQERKRSGFEKWISGRGPASAMATWMPAARSSRPTDTQIGVEHGRGPNALKFLAGEGVDLPEGWRKRQDHAKHGIVVEVPVGVGNAEVVEWMVDAVIALTEKAEPNCRLYAKFYRGR